MVVGGCGRCRRYEAIAARMARVASPQIPTTRTRTPLELVSSANYALGIEVPCERASIMATLPVKLAKACCTSLRQQTEFNIHTCDL